jgi:hypothetical protein
MSEIARPTPSDAAAEPVRFGPAVVAVFVSRAIGGTIIALLWSLLPLHGHAYAYSGWSRYVIGYSLAACVVGAFFLPLLLRMFGYEISYVAALVALFVGVIAANFVFGVLASGSGASPYWTLPISSTFGPIGSIVSLLVSAWIVVQSARRRRRT